MKLLIFVSSLMVVLVVTKCQEFDGFEGFDASSFDQGNFGGQDLTGFDSGSFDGFPNGGGASEFGGGAGEYGGGDFNLGQFNAGQFGGGESEGFNFEK